MQPPDELDPTVDLEPNEDIIERTAPGEEPLWLWTQTCPVEDCPCRTALVVAAASREQLDAHVDVVRDAWDEAEDADAFQAALPAEAVAFEIEIDSGGISMPLADDAQLSPAVARVARRMDGELLDRLASQWHRGKESPDTSTVPVSPAAIRGFVPGQLLAWDEVYTGARMDIYPCDGAAVEAIDTYCVRPKCECNEVRIQFYELPEMEDEEDSEGRTAAPVDADADEDDTNGDEGEDDVEPESTDGEGGSTDHDADDEGHVFIGTVSVKLEEPVKVEAHPAEGRKADLEDLFEQYQSRYPNWVQRLAERADQMAAFGEKLTAHLERKKLKPKQGRSPGRNGMRH